MAATKALIVHPIYSKLLSRFPQFPQFSFCFAYGSGVKKQLTDPTKSSSNMIDFIYCVDDASKWHEKNLAMNSDDYSSLRYLGHNFVAKFQENSGAKVYFNTLVPAENTTIKYGVISTRDLITDLLDWSDLYVAGRLHKPVEIVVPPTNIEVLTALQLNLQSAVHAALLILPETFTEYEFYHTISQLSYNGDFRMIVGENKNKVENIVRPQIIGFRNLYTPFMPHLSDYVDFPMIKILDEDSKTNTGSVPVDDYLFCRQDTSPLARLHHLNQLPRWPQKALTKYWNKGNYKQDTEDVLRSIAYAPDCSNVVQTCIDNIVLMSSIRQSLKGILTAGIGKSIKYSSKKIIKMFNSLK